MIPYSQSMYLDTKTKSIPLVKLVKFKFFHTRVCHLVVTFDISATTGPIQKSFFAE